jgi:hypothetical protein
VEQAADPVVTAEAIELQLFCARCRFSYRRWLRQRWPLAERAVREGFANSGGFVFVDEAAEEVATVEAGCGVQRRRVAAVRRLQP